MITKALKYPLTIDGEEVPRLTLRRVKARDMVIIADHLPALAALEGANGDDPTQFAKQINGAVYKAMIAVVGALSDIGYDAASELDMADLTELTPVAIGLLGEAEGSDGGAPIGE